MPDASNVASKDESSKPAAAPSEDVKDSASESPTGGPASNTQPNGEQEDAAAAEYEVITYQIGPITIEKKVIKGQGKVPTKNPKKDTDAADGGGPVDVAKLGLEPRTTRT